MNGFYDGFAMGLFFGVVLGMGISIIGLWIEHRRNKIEYEKENPHGDVESEIPTKP